ncbi:hypothetical protein I3842_16G057300 [Carya illinoinensis]|uniref:Uncharacterized protein n=1 Tax=Carya illinoinensis TaxID=32201 RepID=A0A922D4F5_CARIL|nr:hypothetical protein I3842_16G057300 [Carya illinoinensis]
MVKFMMNRRVLKISTESKYLDATNLLDCKGKCNYTCSKASRHRMCIRACNTCCSRCNCVPPGTSGNYEVCPC